MKYLLYTFALLSIITWTDQPPVADPDTPVTDALRALGAPERADLMVRQLEGVSAELGQRIVLEGELAGGGKQSAHFKCTSCHNVVREDPVLVDPDPLARLDYAAEQNLPFLPGTTLWGAVNRDTYYNGDYEKKYGDLVNAARHDLRGAIQLCATECAQGRALDEVEMESVLAYLHTIGLRLRDLDLDQTGYGRINRAIQRGGDYNVNGLIRELKQKFLLASPATFVLPPEDRKSGYPVADTPDPTNGARIYDRACLHCHEDQRYSFFALAETEHDYQFLTKHFPRYTRYSVYQVSRYGTSPIPGKRAYMPHYTAERMTDGQLEDLRAYLEEGSSK
ncbi:MAG: c-type cytochrome [Bacteroidota bacterium]